MSHSSIGTASSDNNENHGFDELPSKTMGAESGSNPSAADAASNNQSKVGGDPADFPERPNVAPTPGKKEVAKGNG